MIKNRKESLFIYFMGIACLGALIWGLENWEPILETADDVVQAEKANRVVPCKEIVHADRSWGSKYQDLVLIESLLIHEIETGHKFKSCRHEIDIAYSEYCETYSKIVANHIDDILSGSYWYQTKYIEGACKGDHTEHLNKYSKQLVLEGGNFHINPGKVTVLPKHISSISVAEWSVNNSYVMSVNFSHGDSLNLFFDDEIEAVKRKKEILDLVNKT